MPSRNDSATDLAECGETIYSLVGALGTNIINIYLLCRQRQGNSVNRLSKWHLNWDLKLVILETIHNQSHSLQLTHLKLYAFAQN